MFAKIYDRVLLVFALIITSPLIIVALAAIAIGYPLHLAKNAVFARAGGAGTRKEESWSALTQSRSKVNP